MDNAWRNRDIVRPTVSEHLPSTYVDRFCVDGAVFERAITALLLDVMGEDGVMLGSDYPFPLGEQQVGRLVRQHPGLSERVKEKVLWRNAAAFFGIDA